MNKIMDELLKKYTKEEILKALQEVKHETK